MAQLNTAAGTGDSSKKAPANSSGDWLYEYGVVGWLSRPELRRQLPLPFRLFAGYCNLQKPFGRAAVIGGKGMLQAAMKMHKMRGGKNSTMLDLGTHQVFLNLEDPRMLQVPNEFLKERTAVTVIKSFVSGGDTFLDVGANHGSFSIILSESVGSGGRVVSIEPQPQMAALVEKALKANGKSPFEVHSFACGDRNGEIQFFIPKSTSGAAGVFPGFSATDEHETLTVPLKKFDDAIAWQSFPGKVFLKLDIEGSELSFLRGARQMLEARRPHILLEINPHSSAAAGLSVEKLIDYLKEIGYTQFVELKMPVKHQPLSEIDMQHQRNVIIAP